jgi:hypothetical protein
MGSSSDEVVAAALRRRGPRTALTEQFRGLRRGRSRSYRSHRLAHCRAGTAVSVLSARFSLALQPFQQTRVAVRRRTAHRYRVDGHRAPVTG